MRNFGCFEILYCTLGNLCTYSRGNGVLLTKNITEPAKNAETTQKKKSPVRCPVSWPKLSESGLARWAGIFGLIGLLEARTRPTSKTGLPQLRHLWRQNPATLIESFLVGDLGTFEGSIKVCVMHVLYVWSYIGSFYMQPKRVIPHEIDLILHNHLISHTEVYHNDE